MTEGRRVPFFDQPALKSAEHPWAGFHFEESVSNGEPLGSHAWLKTTLLLVRGGRSSLRWKHRGSWNNDRCQQHTVSIVKRDIEIQAAIPSTNIPILILQLDKLKLEKIAPDYFLSIETSLPAVRVAQDQRIGIMMSMMSDEVKSRCSSGRLYGEALSIALLSYIAANYAHRHAGAKPDYSLSPYQTRRLLDYIRSNLTHDISVSDMASHVNLSPSHFTRVFSRSFGVTPYRFVMHERIELAKVMLAHDEISASNISATLGFSSYSHFSLVFRQFAGVTPKQFKSGL